MKQKVSRKQQNSAKCLVCGLNNNLGLKAAFFELNNGEVAAIFTPLEEHQSYPGRLHGGMSGAILDETIGRAIMAGNKDTWAVTVELNLKYLKPVPLNEPLRAVGRITKDNRRLFEGTGEILLANGEVAVSATGKYLKMPIGRITEADALQWKVTPSDEDPEEIEI